MKAAKFRWLCRRCELTPVQIAVAQLLDEGCESDYATAALMLTLAEKNAKKAKTEDEIH